MFLFFILYNKPDLGISFELKRFQFLDIFIKCDKVYPAAIISQLKHTSPSCEGSILIVSLPHFWCKFFKKNFHFPALN